MAKGKTGSTVIPPHSNVRHIDTKRWRKRTDDGEFESESPAVAPGTDKVPNTERAQLKKRVHQRTDTLKSPRNTNPTGESALQPSTAPQSADNAPQRKRYHKRTDDGHHVEMVDAEVVGDNELAIADGLRILGKADGNVFGVELLPPKNQPPYHPGYLKSRYFTDVNQAAAHIAELDGKPGMVCVTMNTINPAMLDEPTDTHGYQRNVKAEDVAARTRLLIDIDAKRVDADGHKRHVNSTDAELQQALDLGFRIREELRDRLGWPEPRLIMSSGNGCHIHYDVYLPNDWPGKAPSTAVSTDAEFAYPSADELVKQCLHALADTYDTPDSAIDTSCHNAGRLARIPGTVNAKYAELPDRPQRNVHVYWRNPQPDIVSVESLVTLASLAPKAEQRRRSQEEADEAGEWRIDDVGEWLQRHHLEVAYTKALSYGTVYVLEECPYEASHRRKFFVTQLLTGGLSAQCWKANCAGHGITFGQFRDRVEPNWREALHQVTHGFRVDDHGVWFTPERPRRGEDEVRAVRVAYPAVHVVMRTRTEHSIAWGKTLRWTDFDGHPHEWTAPAELLGGRDSGEVVKMLRSGGVEVYEDALMTKYIISRNPEERGRCVSTLGWYKDVFVMPGKIIGKTDEKIVYQSPHGPLVEMSSSGTLEAWKEHVAQYCVGNSRLLFAVSMAFAAPLLEALGEEGGGAHMFGKSSTGKTTTQCCGVSVYGNHQTMFTWSATINGLEGVAEARNAMLLVLDEFTRVSSRDAGQAAYLLASGIGKARLKGDATNRPVKRWIELFLSSGEKSLAQHMSEVGKTPMAGQEVRMLEIPIPTVRRDSVFEDVHGFEDDKALAEHLRKTSNRYYGTAFDAFISAVQEAGFGEVETLVREMMEEWLEEHLPKDATGQVGRGANRFALIGAAGELASALGITGWPEGAAHDAAVKCFYAWVDHRGGSSTSVEERNAIRQVSKFFAEYGDIRFDDDVDEEDDKAKARGVRAGFKTFLRDPRYRDEVFCVWPIVWETEVCKGLDPQYVAEVLARRGALVKDADGKHTRSTYWSVNPKKRPRMYVITKKVFMLLDE